LCGYIGIVNNIKPRMPITGRVGDEADDAMPWNLEAALEAMSDCDEIREYLGDAFVDGFVGTRWAEYEGFKRVISSWEREFLLSTV
jgi:glutamine synthetase